MLFVNWFIGPQLLGILFLTAGLIQKFFPPKKINSLYGYRTPASMRNQQTWDEGNRYATVLMMKCGVVMIIAGLLITVGIVFVRIDIHTKALIKVGLMLAGAFGTVIVLLTSTERHLKRMFDNKI